MSNVLIVEESPVYAAVGEVIAYVFDFADVGVNDPSAAGTTLAYDASGTDQSSSVLSGSASLSGSQVTAKTFTPASAQTYRLVQPATVDGNTVMLAVDVIVDNLAPGS